MLKLRMVERNVLDNYTDLPVGEVLRRVRNQYALELPYVAASLNIRPEHLAAIEAGDISRLPGRVYAIGFVRTYADYLKLDSDKIVYMFKSQVIGHTIARDLNFPIPVTETRSPAWWMVAASVGTLALIGLLVWALSGSTEAEPDMPVAAAETTKAADAAPTAPVVDETTPIKQGDGKLTVTAKEASWVEIRSGDNPDEILFSRVLKKGESYTAPDQDSLTLSTGNAEGVAVTWAGKKIDIFEGRKGIVRNLPVGGLAAYKVEDSAPAAKSVPAQPAASEQE